MKAEDIRKVVILGGGTMGRQISVPCAIAGCDVSIYDINQSALDDARKGVAGLMHIMVKMKKVTEEGATAALGRISYTTDETEAARDADFLSESVPEDPALKSKIFGRFNELCPERAIFTTNTSTLFPSMFADATGRPGQFAAFHFHDIRMTTVVDVMPHPGTSKETVELVTSFAERIGQSPIVLNKESMGYVFNKMLTSLFYAAQTIAANDIASPHDVDRAWMGVTHMFMGPFAIMDSIGIDTIWKISDYWAEKQNDPQGIKNTAFLKQYVDRGENGQKSGKGFYTYPHPEYATPEFVSGKKGN